MTGWTLNPAYAHLAEDFGTLATVFALDGERLTHAPRSEVIRVTQQGVRYYVKRYNAGSPRNGMRRWLRNLRHGLRNFLPRPRVQAEWENLEHFAQWGIPTAEIVASGLERKFGAFWRGALITRELEGTEDLRALHERHDPRLQDRRWVARLCAQIAAHTRTLHAHRFVHNDLKWRNLLVDQNGTVYFIDCPLGDFWRGPMLRHRMEKDLATLDKVARHCLSASVRLRFYLDYRQHTRLTKQDKASIRRIVRFFDGED